MLASLQGGVQRTSEPLAQLMIDRRVLITPVSTICIANIAVVATGSVNIPRRAIWAAGAAMLAIGPAGVMGGYYLKNILVMALACVLAVAGLLVIRVFASTAAHCLSISTTGGEVAMFVGDKGDLEKVRRLLTNKINARDESATYSVNFEKRVIQPLSAPAHAGRPELGDQPLPLSAHPFVPRLGGAGRTDPQNGFLHGMTPAVNAPTPPLAGDHFNGSAVAHVDFSQVLPQIVDMQRFYAQRPDTQEIAERLNELEYLMRSGTPTAAGRNRLGQLVNELSAILGAYPGVVQIFQQAARLAGT
jgi:hypothetical protein